MDSFQEGLDLVKEIDHPNIKLQLDIFHLQQIEGNLSRNIEKYLPYVGHIQVAQVSTSIAPSIASYWEIIFFTIIFYTYVSVNNEKA